MPGNVTKSVMKIELSLNKPLSDLLIITQFKVG